MCGSKSRSPKVKRRNSARQGRHVLQTTFRWPKTKIEKMIKTLDDRISNIFLSTKHNAQKSSRDTLLTPTYPLE